MITCSIWGSNPAQEGGQKQNLMVSVEASLAAIDRWEYTVRGGDVVHMYGGCQARLQHSIRVEREAGDAGPRASLVYKRRAAITPPPHAPYLN